MFTTKQLKGTGENVSESSSLGNKYSFHQNTDWLLFRVILRGKEEIWLIYDLDNADSREMGKQTIVRFSI